MHSSYKTIKKVWKLKNPNAEIMSPPVETKLRGAELQLKFLPPTSTIKYLLIIHI